MRRFSLVGSEGPRRKGPRWALVVGLGLAWGCRKADCSLPGRELREDGNCYAVDLSAEDDSGLAAVDWLVDVGVTAGIQDRFRRNRGLAAADFDLDGDVDVFLANPGDPTTLLINDGTGVFHTQPDTPTSGYDSAAAAADYDNDGDPDLLLTCGGWSTACANLLLRNDGVDPGTGEVILTDVSVASGIGGLVSTSFGIAWADYDLDGDLDVFINSKVNWSDPDADASNQLYRNNGDGTFSEVGEAAGVSEAGDNHIACWLDIEPDGDPDLFVPALYSDNHLYVNQGDGTFLDLAPSHMRDPYQSFGSSVADFDNDGLLDILVTANSGSAWAPEDRGDETTLFINRSEGEFDAVKLSDGLSEDSIPLRVMGFALGDLDMDGQTDLFFGTGEPASGGVNRLFLADHPGDGTLEWEDISPMIDHEAEKDDRPEVYRPYPYRTHATVMIDVDGDYDLDLLIANGGMNLMPDQEEPNRLFLNRAAVRQRAIRVDIEGTRSNRDAVGALLTIWSDEEPDRPVVRQVTRSNGFNASIPRVQLIGLGDRLPPYTLQVRWPLGDEQTVHIAEAWTTVRVVEPD